VSKKEKKFKLTEKIKF